MPMFYIRAINSTFQTRDEGKEYALAEHALRAGVDAAIAIATDELRQGRTNTAVEVCIEDRQEEAVLRSVVSLGVCTLQLRA